MSNPKKLHVEYATKEDMEAARESSKEQPIARKAEPLSSDPWQQDWGRDEKINITKVRSFTNKIKTYIISLMILLKISKHLGSIQQDMFIY